MQEFNEKTYQIQIEAYDQLDYSFSLTTSYKPVFTSVLEELVDYIESGCCTWSGYTVALAKHDFGSLVNCICQQIAEKMLTDATYRQEMIADLTDNMKQMFDLAAVDSAKITEDDREMLLGGARGIEEYLPKINSLLDQSITDNNRKQVIEEIAYNLFVLSMMHYDIVRIEGIEVTE